MAAESAQLQRLLAEKAKLEEEAKHTKNIIKVSVGAEEIIKFCQETPDPFHPDHNPTNPWTEKGKSGGICMIL